MVRIQVIWRGGFLCCLGAGRLLRLACRPPWLPGFRPPRRAPPGGGRLGGDFLRLDLVRLNPRWPGPYAGRCSRRGAAGL